MANEVMMQSFEWDTWADGSFYKKSNKECKKIKGKWNRRPMASTYDQGWVRHGRGLWSL